MNGAPRLEEMPEFRVRGWGWWGRDKGQSIGDTGSSSCWPEESGVIRRTRDQAGGNRERSMCFLGRKDPLQI